MLDQQPCVLCGSSQRAVVYEQEVYGLPLTTVVCLQCGLVYHHPLRSVQEKLEAVPFDESQLHLGHVETGVLPRKARRWARRFAAALEPEWQSAQSLLDIGCGQGGLLVEAQQRGLSAVGVEPGARNAATARLVSGATVHEAHLEDAELGGQRFDIISSTHVLEHTEDPRDFLLKARALLSPQGRLFLEVPNILRPMVPLYRALPLQHNYFFTPLTLAAMVRTAGLRPVRERVYRRDVVSIVCVADEQVAPAPPSPEHAQEVIRTLAAYRWAYYATGMCLWRHVRKLRDFAAYGRWTDMTCAEEPAAAAGRVAAS